MFLANNHPVSQSCPENGKVGPIESLRRCFVLVDWSPCRSPGTITDGHRARCGIMVYSLVTALGQEVQVEAGNLACCLLTQHTYPLEQMSSRAFIQRRGRPDNALNTPSPLYAAGQGEAVPTGLPVSTTPLLFSSPAWFGMRPPTSSGPLGEMCWIVASSPRIR